MNKLLGYSLVLLFALSLLIFTVESRQLAQHSPIHHKINNRILVPGPSPVYFDCKDKEDGFHADLYRRCKVFHYCKPESDTMTFYCPGDWIFDDVVKSCGSPETVVCQEYVPILV